MHLDKKHIEDLDKRENGYYKLALNDEVVTLYSDGTTLKNCIVYKGQKDGTLELI
ncbi:MAG: hypothetical protein JJV95_07040 [Sulfurospirillum sp.]|nr:hypothetical protein [Sulfurospirillum sp.]